MQILRTINQDQSFSNIEKDWDLNRLTSENERAFTTFIAQQKRTLQLPEIPQSSKDDFIIFYLEKHIDRLILNAQSLNTNFLDSNINSGISISNHCKEAISWYINQQLCSQIRVRVIVDNRSLAIHMSPYENPWANKCISLKTVEISRRNPEIKSTHMPQCIKARELAMQHGYDEALLMSDKSIVQEGAWSNIFWIDADDNIYTSATNILPGVTRSAICENHKIQIEDFRLETLLDKSKEVFITQSTSGITPVCGINNFKFDVESKSKTEYLKKCYLLNALQNATTLKI